MVEGLHWCAQLLPGISVQRSGPRIDQHLAGKLPGDTLMVPLVPTRGVDLIINIGIQEKMR